MENQLISVNFRTVNYTARNEVLDDVNYLVVPVIMMQDGVHSGSAGALYHSIAELGQPDWNNIPVVINHPQVGNTFVSANSESVLDTDRVGIIRNTHVEGTQLKAEAWLDVTKMAAHQPSLLNRITGGEIINVSVGVFTDTIDKHIVLTNGDVAEHEAINHVPDHLAILPHDLGACSVEDGCGIRVNAEDTSKMDIKLNINDNTKGGQRMNKEEVFKALSNYKKEDISVNELNQLIEALKPLNLGMLATNVCAECLQTNEVGILQQVNSVRMHLDSMDNSEATYYLEEMNNDSTIVYRVETRNQRRGSSLYKQTYAINDAGVVVFEGEPTAVVKKVSYDTVNALKRTKFNTNEKEVEEMAKVNELAASLIAHAGTSFVEDDKVWLETLSEVQLNKLVPKEVEEVKVNTVVDAVSQLSVEDKSALDFGKQQLKAHREGLVAKITANTKEGVWDAASLNAMDNNTLGRIADSVVVPETQEQSAGVYIGGGAAPQVNAGSQEAMYPAGVEIEVKK